MYQSRCESCVYNSFYVKSTREFCSLGNKCHSSSDDLGSYLRLEDDPAYNCMDHIFRSEYYKDCKSYQDNLYIYENALSILMPINVEDIKDKRLLLGKYSKKFLVSIHTVKMGYYTGNIIFYKKGLIERKSKYIYGNYSLLDNIISKSFQNRGVLGKVLLEVYPSDIKNPHYVYKNLKGVNYYSSRSSFIHDETYSIESSIYDLREYTDVLLEGIGVEGIVEPSKDYGVVIQEIADWLEMNI